MADVRFKTEQCGERYSVHELRNGRRWWSRLTWEPIGEFPSLPEAEAEIQRRSGPRRVLHWYGSNGKRTNWAKPSAV
jgi:hypothetical protein